MKGRVKISREREDCRTIGDYIRYAREAAEMSREELCMWAQLDVNSIQRWEMGETFPNVTTLIRVADVLDVSLDYLVGRDCGTGKPVPYAAEEVPKCSAS